MKLRRPSPILLVAVANLVVALVIAIGAYELNRATNARTEALCNNEDLARSYELLNRSDGNYREGLVHDLEPILDCQLSREQGKPVAVTLAVQHEYLELVNERRRWPVLDDGQIVGSRPLPSDLQRQR